MPKFEVKLKTFYGRDREQWREWLETRLKRIEKTIDSAAQNKTPLAQFRN
jgi:hypothetical protein